jgi:ligand-binding SRPBCC domain-containing protein
MAIYNINEEQFLPISIEEAWDFFSSPANLAKITPPELSFVIKSDVANKPIFSGMQIDYTIKPLFSIPMNWRTGISHVDAPNNFVDRQLKGPYKRWEHRHTFTAVPGGVKMNDKVVYELPLGILGTLAHIFIVKRKLDKIFSFRRDTLIKLFGEFKPNKL